LPEERRERGFSVVPKESSHAEAKTKEGEGEESSAGLEQRESTEKERKNPLRQPPLRDLKPSGKNLRRGKIPNFNIREKRKSNLAGTEQEDRTPKKEGKRLLIILGRWEITVSFPKEKIETLPGRPGMMS